MGVEGTIGALVGATHLTDTEDVQRGRIECLHIELLRPQRLYDHRLSGPREVGHGEIPRINTINPLSVSVCLLWDRNILTF